MKYQRHPVATLVTYPFRTPQSAISSRCCLLSRWKLRNLFPGFVSSHRSPAILAMSSHSSGSTLTLRPLPSSEPGCLSPGSMVPTCQSFLNERKANPAAFAPAALARVSSTSDPTLAFHCAQKSAGSSP